MLGRVLGIEVVGFISNYRKELRNCPLTYLINSINLADFFCVLDFDVQLQLHLKCLVIGMLDLRMFERGHSQN